jgi:hypothetical protein
MLLIKQINKKTFSCKHLENQTVAWELRRGFRDNAFMKNRNGNLGGGDLYSGRVAVIKGSSFVNSDLPRVEAGSNTSTVTLRVVGGDKKGSLESETVKCGRESQGTRTRE